MLSPSTKACDRRETFTAYRTIASFRKDLLIDQTRPRVEPFVKQTENQWLFSDFEGLDARLTLASLEVELALADLYYENWDGNSNGEPLDFARNSGEDEPSGAAG